MKARWLGTVKSREQALELAKEHGLKTVAALRWSFSGEDTIEVYTWPLEQTEYFTPVEVWDWVHPEWYIGLSVYATGLL